MVLRQPFSIAVLASVGLHGLLWAALPNMLANTEKELDTKRRVQVVELSPAEQGQLPSLGLNEVPTLLPTKPTPPVESGTKLPDLNKPYSYPLDTIPVFPPPDIYSGDFSGLFPKKDPEPKKEPKKQTTGKTNVPPPPAPDPKASEPPKSATPGGKDGKVDEPRSKTLSPEQLAKLQKDAERSRELRSLYAFSGPKTQDEALESAKTNATVFVDAAVKLSGGEYDSKRYQNAEKIESPFPDDACPFMKDSRTSTVGVIVKPDGQLAEKPTLLLTSGFKGLDTIAIDEIAKTKFTTSERFQIVRFEVAFNPSSVCKATRSKPS